MLVSAAGRQGQVHALRVLTASAECSVVYKPQGIPFFAANEVSSSKRTTTRGEMDSVPAAAGTNEDTLLSRFAETSGIRAFREEQAALVLQHERMEQRRHEGEQGLLSSEGSGAALAVDHAPKQSAADVAAASPGISPKLVLDPEQVPVGGSNHQGEAEPLRRLDHRIEKGCTLVAHDDRVHDFLTRAWIVGAVERSYHVACHIPACVSAPSRKFVNVDGVKSRNRSVKAMLEAIEEEAVEAMSGKQRYVPKCIYRDPLVEGDVFVANVLAKSGTLSGVIGGLAKLDNESQKHRRLASLFVQSSAKTSCVASSGGAPCACGAGMCSSTINQVIKTKRKPSGEEAQLSPRFHDQLLVGASRRSPAANHAKHTQTALLTHSGQAQGAARAAANPARLRTVECEFEVKHFDEDLRVAIYEVKTSSCTAAHIRALFHAAGLPVVNDLVYDGVGHGALSNAAASRDRLNRPWYLPTAFTDSDVRLWQSYMRGLRGEDVSASSSGVASEVAVADLSDEERRLVARMLKYGCGIACTGIRFPRPGVTANEHALQHLTSLVKENLKLYAEQRSASLRQFECEQVNAGAPSGWVPGGDITHSELTAGVGGPKSYSWKLPGLEPLPGAAPAIEGKKEEALVPQKGGNDGVEPAAEATAPARSEEYPAEGQNVATTVLRDLVGTVESPGSAQAHAHQLPRSPPLNKKRAPRCRYCGGKHHVTECPKLEGSSATESAESGAKGSGRPQKRNDGRRNGDNTNKQPRPSRPSKPLFREVSV